MLDRGGGRVEVGGRGEIGGVRFVGGDRCGDGGGGLGVRVADVVRGGRVDEFVGGDVADVADGCGGDRWGEVLAVRDVEAGWAAGGVGGGRNDGGDRRGDGGGDLAVRVAEVDRGGGGDGVVGGDDFDGEPTRCGGDRRGGGGGDLAVLVAAAGLGAGDVFDEPARCGGDRRGDGNVDLVVLVADVGRGGGGDGVGVDGGAAVADAGSGDVVGRTKPMWVGMKRTRSGWMVGSVYGMNQNWRKTERRRTY